MDFKIIKYLIIFLLLQFNSQAIEFEGKFIQGHFILGKTDPIAKIQIDKKNVRWNNAKKAYLILRRYEYKSI